MAINKLGGETSPYLLQHQDNPVHWHPWSPEAFAEAKAADKPVLLSVGYAACHWCHVMAHESFEDRATAEVMNRHFINIKVDREERPDVDRVYMQSLHALGEQGGWPLTMFLTPDAEPFWGGTYFPPEPRYGRPSFTQILLQIAQIWKAERGKILQNTSAILAALNHVRYAGGGSTPTPHQIDALASAVVSAVDLNLGGLKGAPKFPQAPVFAFLWQSHLATGRTELAQAVTVTLKQMTQGGIYDHLGGGLARYSTDAQWLVPHFEKMLYDNAQLIGMLARAWLKDPDPLFIQRAAETVAFLMREMRNEEGCFTSSYDADSEGEEGKFYVWEEGEIRALLKHDDADLFCRAYAVSQAGNWEGKTVLNRSHALSLADEETEERLAKSRPVLLNARNLRPPPAHDDKVLTDWNGLTISALAEAALAFSRHDWLQAAKDSFRALNGVMWDKGQLRHSRRAGESKHQAFLDDYAHLAEAALVLHGLTGDPEFLDAAVKTVAALEHGHWDEARGGFFQAAKSMKELPVQIRGIEDDVTPNGNAVMVANYARLFHATGEERYAQNAQQIIDAFASAALANPFAAPSLLKNIPHVTESVQLVLAGEQDALQSLLLRRAISVTGLDCMIQMLALDARLPATHPAAAKPAKHGKPTLYICRGTTCASPATNLVEVDQALELLRLNPA